MTILIGEANNVYYNVPATGSNGSDATFDVYRDNAGAISNIDVVTGGQNYNVGETLTIDGSYIGGSSGTDDIRFTISNVVEGSTGGNNNFFGRCAGKYNTTGNYNNFFGSNAGSCNTTGCYNNFLGLAAGRYNTTGNYNNFFGESAGRNNTSGCFNNFLGYYAGRGTTGRISSWSIASSTTLVGEADADYDGVSASGGNGSGAIFNVYRGGSGAVDAVGLAIEGKNYTVGNTLTIDGAAVGGSSGTDDITITVDAVVGSTGSNNNFLGCRAGENNINGYGNNFFGVAAGLYNIDGYSNNFFGYIAGRDNTTGKYNNFFGPSVGFSNTTGCNNNFFGRRAGYFNTTGNYNNFFGSYAGRNNTTGYDNNFFGTFAGSCNTTGTHNTFLGSYSGISTSASNKIILGRGGASNQRFDAPDPTKDTQFAVGIRTDANPANYWLVGDENFNIGIGTTNLTEKLTVVGNIALNNNVVYGSVNATFNNITPTIIHSGLSTSVYRSVDYTIQAINGTNYQVTKILALHDGLVGYSTTISNLYNNVEVATFNVLLGELETVGITTFTTLIGEADTTYPDISATGGSGFGAIFQVSRDGSGDVFEVGVLYGGQEYQVGDTLIIDGGDVGGSSSTDDIELSVDSINENIILVSTASTNSPHTDYTINFAATKTYITELLGG